MKIPYLQKNISAEFDTYSSELTEHVANCVADIHIRGGAGRLYRLLFPLFMFLRQFDGLDFGGDPTRKLLLDKMRSRGDKQMFVEVMSLPRMPENLRQEVVHSLKQASFTTYLYELWSDALLCLNSFAMCNYRGAHIALRCMLEDLYRHLYYKDHAEEFGALRFDPTAEDKFGISPAEFRDYLTKVSYLQIFKDVNEHFANKSTAEDKDIFALNAELYAKCSGYVHGVKLGEMNSFRSNFHAVRNGGKETDLLNTVERFVKMAVAFLVTAHADEFRIFNEYDKSVVLTAMGREEQHALRKLLNM